MGFREIDRRHTKVGTVHRIRIILANLMSLTLSTAVLPTSFAQSPTYVVEADYTTQDPMSGGCNSKDNQATRSDNDCCDPCCKQHGAPPPSEAAPCLDEVAGDPVSLHNGMVSYREVDLVIPGRGIDFVFS